MEKLCQYHNNIMPEEYMKKHGLNYSQLYGDATVLKNLSLESTPPQKQIIALPLDCYLEAEALGVKLAGYEGCNCLKPCTLDFAEQQLHFNFDIPRLKIVISALAALAAEGKTPCLNLSGFASVFGAVFDSTLFYTRWFSNRRYILDFFAYLVDCYLQIMETAVAKGVRLFSFAEPSVLLPLVGPTFAKEYTDLVLLPFFQKFHQSGLPAVIHICRLTTELTADNDKIRLQNHPLAEPTVIDTLLSTLTADIKKPLIIGGNCINSPSAVNSYTEFLID